MKTYFFGNYKISNILKHAAITYLGRVDIDKVEGCRGEGPDKEHEDSEQVLGDRQLDEDKEDGSSHVTHGACHTSTCPVQQEEVDGQAE